MFRFFHFLKELKMRFQFFKELKMKSNKRSSILCDCGRDMVFTGKVTPPAKEIRLMGLIYRCPTRRGEKGCGHSREVLFDLTTMTNF